MMGLYLVTMRYACGGCKSSNNAPEHSISVMPFHRPEDLSRAVLRHMEHMYRPMRNPKNPYRTLLGGGGTAQWVSGPNPSHGIDSLQMLESSLTHRNLKLWKCRIHLRTHLRRYKTWAEIPGGGNAQWGNKPIFLHINSHRTMRRQGYRPNQPHRIDLICLKCTDGKNR